MSHAPLKIATRGSALARWQAEWVAELLRATEGGSEVELVAISTTGDRQTAAPLAGLGTQGVFTREIQQAVLDGRADLAVHSLKDLPTDPVAGLVLAAVPERAPPEDVMVLPARTASVRSRPTPETGEPRAEALSALAAGARLGTGSLRRRAQLLWLRKDLQLCDVRGNVDTRLRKLDEGQYDALVLARAGLTRLGLQQRISQVLAPGQMLPAVGQGAVGVECRADELGTQSLLARIDHGRTHAAVLAERSLLTALRGGCQAPVGALARFDGERLTLQAVVLSPDGSRRLAAADAVPMTRVDASGHLRERAEALGRRVGEELFRQGAAELIAMARA